MCTWAVAKTRPGQAYIKQAQNVVSLPQTSEAQNQFTWHGICLFPKSPEANMHLSACKSCHLVFLFCILVRSCQAFKNDATEILYSHVGTPVQDARSNVSLNRARNGGRGAGNTAGNDRVGEYCSVFFLKTLRNCALFLTIFLLFFNNCFYFKTSA